MTAKKTAVGKKTFPADANVKILVEGLAFCYLKPKSSKINFLSHVPFHKLNLKVEQKRRGSDKVIFSLDTMIDFGHTISIKTDHAITPDNVATDGNFPLSELINITLLHGRKINKKNFPPECTPIALTVDNCAFYTERMTRDKFEISETDETDKISAAPRKIGYSMGGIIKCSDTNGNLTIEIKGVYPTKIKRPMSDADGDFIFEISFTNHCMEIDKCKELMKDDSDFRFYYDVLEDSKDTGRKFKLKKSGIVIKTIDVGACNVVIVEPPPV